MTRRRGAPPHERACRLGAGCRCARPPPGSPLRSDPAPRGAGGDLDPVSAHRRGAITGSRPRPATQLARHDHDENRPGRLHLSKARFWSERWGPPQTDHVALRHPPRLSLAERMHHLDTADGPPRRGEPLKPQHGPRAAFDESMVLLDDVVQILALAKIRTRSDESLVLDGRERDRVGGVLVYGHHARGRRMRRAERLAEERDGGLPVARRSQQEIQGIAVGIDATVEIRPGPADTSRRSHRSDTSRWCASGMADTVCRSLAHSAAPIDRSSYGRHTGPARASCP